MTITFPELSRAGRLGNQLWEVASTIGIARSHGAEPSFPLWDYQPFFNVPPEYFTHYPAGEPATDFVPHMDPRARMYLQDYSLFADIEDEIRSYFRPSPKALEVLESNYDWLASLPRPFISVHVRRGDNVTHPSGYHPLRSMSYYRRALEELPSGSIIMFTDDPGWCEDNFERETGFVVADMYLGTPRPREYVDREKYETAPVLDWIDLQLMAHCDHHVISNSTYAWWGAFLSEDRSPIYPSNWFGRHVTPWTDSSLMFPASWREVADTTEGGI